jgi:hypothetical protein
MLYLTLIFVKITRKSNIQVVYKSDLTSKSNTMEIDEDMELIEAEKMSNVKQSSKSNDKISNENVENKKPVVKHSITEEKPKPVASIIKDEPKESEVKKPKLIEETNKQQAPPAQAVAAAPAKKADPKKPAKPANQSTLTSFFKKA